MTGQRRVVVTGMGIVSAGGFTPDAFWSGLARGASSVRPITRFDAAGFPSRIAGEILGFDLREVADLPDEWSTRGRIAQYAAVAVDQAVSHAGGVPSGGRPRMGVAVAAGLSTYHHAELIGPSAASRQRGGEFEWPAFTAALKRLLKESAAERRSPGSIPALLARHYDVDGPIMSVMTACAGGTQAIGDATRWIRLGVVDAAVACGADCELQPMGLASFCLLGALSRRNDAPDAASRPFDGRRDGFVLGEGAGALVLEERERALRRGAVIHAEIAGFGSACDAYRVTDPHPQGVGAVLAMRRALEMAEVRPDDVDYINAHGTSTSVNDRAETLAIKRVFGDAAPGLAVSSTKSMVGHATVAAGAIEAVATVQTLVHQVIHPTINQVEPDTACDLDYVPNRARAASVEIAMSNSFAFGGQCAALILRRHHN